MTGADTDGRLAWPAGSPRGCVYTVLFGGYEELSEQPIRQRSQLDFLCLTDDPDLRSDTWEIRVVEPFLYGDSVRSSREPKIRPHLHLHGHDVSLYIDNSVRLLEPPEVVIEMLLPGEKKLGVLEHSFRRHRRARVRGRHLGAARLARP